MYDLNSFVTDLSMGFTYIPPLGGLGQSLDAMAVVPVASALLGPTVGLASAKAVTSHFRYAHIYPITQQLLTSMCSVMVKGLSQFFAAGPPVVKQATFEDLSKEELGGWEVHATNGSVDNVATSELDALHQIRVFLSYLPSSIFQLPPTHSTSDKIDRREEELISIIPRRRARAYEIRKVVRMLVDQDPESGSSFFEIGATWGRCIVTGFARLDGKPVGVLSSDCTSNGGAIDAFGSQKTARFVNLCDHFG